MKNYIYSFIIFILSSCITEPKTRGTITTIVNNSEHNIELQAFKNGIFQSVTIIDNNKKHEVAHGGLAFNPPFSADSVWVIYFNKASIMHTKGGNSPVSKSLMLETSYEGGKTGGGIPEFTYTFTPDDYEEALEFGD